LKNKIGEDRQFEEAKNRILARYRPWFYAAAWYNLVWGSLYLFYPNQIFDIIGMERPGNPILWQVVGMFVLVYAPAYWWVARNPDRHRHFILIGMMGKTFGLLGIAWAVAAQRLPLAFGWAILFMI
jgi:hypothetical protein